MNADVVVYNRGPRFRRKKTRRPWQARLGPEVASVTMVRRAKVRRRPRASAHARVRLVRFTNGNRLVVFPGVRSREIVALGTPERWEWDRHQQITTRGTAIFTTRDAKGKTMWIVGKPLNNFAAPFHEPRMLRFLREQGVLGEQPLGLLMKPGTARPMLITRAIHEPRSLVARAVDSGQVRAALQRLGVIDLDHRGIPETMVGMHGRRLREFLLDAERIVSTREPRLGEGRHIHRKYRKYYPGI